MNRAEKAALARMLEDIAARLEAAPSSAEQAAAADPACQSASARSAYALGHLESATREAKHAIRIAIKTYIQPATTKKEG